MSAEFFPATGMPDRDWWSALWPDPEATLRALGLKPGLKVVDLCCGDGYFTAPLARLVGGGVIAVDLDPAMLELARTEVERQGAPPCRWVCGDVRDLPDLLSEAVDFVLLANTFHGVPDQPALAVAVAAVLLPGGRFAIVNWHPLPRQQTTILDRPRGPPTAMRMAPDRVRAVVEPAGFVLDRVVELPPYHYGSILNLGPRGAPPRGSE